METRHRIEIHNNIYFSVKEYKKEERWGRLNTSIKNTESNKLENKWLTTNTLDGERREINFYKERSYYEKSEQFRSNDLQSSGMGSETLLFTHPFVMLLFEKCIKFTYEEM